MSGHASQFAVFPGGVAGRGRMEQQFQELWFSVVRRPWASLVLVPADESLSTGWLATGLADVGTRLRDTPVNAIVAESIDFASARSLAELQPRLHRASGWSEPAEVEAEITTEPANGSGPPHEAQMLPPFGRVIISIQPVVSQPLGVAIAHAADAVVVCVRLGASRAKATRRTVELIGPDRIIGALLVR